MKTLKSALSALLLAGAVAFAGAQARAELSQEEQLRQAQEAYEASSQSYEEVEAGWQEALDLAEAVEETAFEVLQLLVE